MDRSCRYNYIDRIAPKRVIPIVLLAVLLCGCGKEAVTESQVLEGARNEEASDSHVAFDKLHEANEDIFAWVYVPDTNIDYPVCQSSKGDDSFYITHNALKEPDPKGAIYTECANLKNMCDFNEILHGSSPSDGTMFAGLDNFLDRKYFEDHKFIHVYTEGNALLYYIFAAFVREDTRLIAEYDFTYASGCQEFLDEIYDQKSMNKIIRTGWEHMVEPENFIITLSTKSPEMDGRQIVVVGCLVGDVRGEIDRYMDYSDPEDEWGE